MRLRICVPALVIAACFAANGCRSAHVDITVENHTGAEVRLLEVDYPSASFGADRLAAGGSMHYRVQLQGSGNVKVQYVALDRKQWQTTGPELTEGEDGALQIVLMPAGKADFEPEFRGRK